MLLEEGISLILEDPILKKKIGFFRVVPLLFVLYHPVFTYHAKKWYVRYMMANGKFDTLFSHNWVHSKEISNPKLATEYNSLSILLIRKIIERQELEETESFTTIVKRAVDCGFNHVVVTIDEVEGLRLNKRRTRTVESLVPTGFFNNKYSSWLKSVKTSLPTIRCKSKSVILESYGVYELARASLESSLRTKNSIEDFDDMMTLDFPLLVMDILLKISRGIRKPYPFTHIRIAEIKRVVKPWFENKGEAKQIVTRCYEKVPDLTHKTWTIRKEVGKRIEKKLLSWCKSKQAIDVHKQIREVVNRCAI